MKKRRRRIRPGVWAAAALLVATGIAAYFFLSAERAGGDTAANANQSGKKVNPASRQTSSQISAQTSAQTSAQAGSETAAAAESGEAAQSASTARSAKDTARLEAWKKSLEEQIEDYFDDELSNVGIVYYDIVTGQKVEVNENSVFLAASTSKVQMNMLAYQAVEAGTLSLDQGIAYTSDDYEAGTGRLLTDYDKSQPIALSTLLDYSIKYSDNIAKNMVMRILGGKETVRAKTNQMVGTSTDTSGNWVTPEEEYRLLRKLYENKADKYYAHLIQVMKNTIFHDRIDKYIPQSIVAHKIGDYGNYVNDVGIVFTGNPYILVVYTSDLPGLSEKQPHEKIAGLSRLIYEAHLKK